MAGIKISGLPSVTSALLTDFLPVVQGGVTSQETLLKIATLFGFNSSTNLLALSAGGTNANLTAANGAIPYSTASAFALLAPGTAGQLFQSGGAGAPNWTTSTYPATNAVNTLLYASSANVMAALATANSSVLVTSSGGVPSLSTVLPGGLTTTDPVVAQGLATKNYVDQNALNGTSVYAASAATLGTVTQSGAGVGATLTNAGTQATFALDGVNPPVGSNVLIKNTATGMTSANEGIYTVTNAGSGATNWVLTRSTDYDTVAEINTTGLILVQNGSSLAGTAWYNAATIVTLDTTAFSYSEFGNIIFPITLANGGTSASLTASNGGIFYSTASAGAILAGTATARQMLQSGASGAPAWSTTTYPATNAINTLLYASAANVMSALATANNSVLVTSAGGVPSLSTTLPSAVQVSTGSLNSGTSASSSTFWRGDGTWASAITRVITQTFTSSGTYTPTAGMLYCWVRAVGGGGAGGGAPGVTSQICVGSGGGAGSYSERVLTAAQVGASQTATIGAAGTSGGAANGNPGTGTTLGSLVTTSGGGGGLAGTASATLSRANGAAGGAAGTGDFSSPGGSGDFGFSLTVYAGFGGAGGASVYGAGGAGISTVSSFVNGNVGSNYGAGGGGAVAVGSTNGSGGAGVAGLIVIHEFCTP